MHIIIDTFQTIMSDVSQSLETCEVFLTFLPVHIPQSFLSHPLQHMTTETENKINIREKPCMKKNHRKHKWWSRSAVCKLFFLSPEAKTNHGRNNISFDNFQVSTASYNAACSSDLQAEMQK